MLLVRDPVPETRKVMNTGIFVAEDYLAKNYLTWAGQEKWLGNEEYVLLLQRTGVSNPHVTVTQAPGGSDTLSGLLWHKAIVHIHTCRHSHIK